MRQRRPRREYIAPDLTVSRVVSPALCPLCGHDNREPRRSATALPAAPDEQTPCDHFVSRVDDRAQVPQPTPGEKVFARGYLHIQGDPALRTRYWVYSDQPARHVPGKVRRNDER